MHIPINLVSYNTVTFEFQLQKPGRDVRTSKNFKLFSIFYGTVLEPGRVLHDPPENPKHPRFSWVRFM
jgi:hypothetical protein